MGDSYAFAVDVFRIVCDRFQAKAADLRRMVETGESFESWLIWEAFLACKGMQEYYPFCEVAAAPTYASEGVADDGRDPERNRGDLRIGGPDDGANHCWLFAEFALLHDGNRTGDAWRRTIEAAALRLERLGWKRSAALLVVLVASRGEPLADRADDLDGCAVWNRPALTDPFVAALPDGGTFVVKAFDIKRDPAHILCATSH